MAMIWNASYETGVPLMDNQHKELFKHMDNLTDKGKADRIPQSLEYLAQYIDKHFGEEQELHRSCNYPQREAHKKLHAGFVDSYKKLRAEFEKSPGKEGVMSMRINRTAVEWLKNHIYEQDKQFAKYYFSLPGNESKAPSALKGGSGSGGSKSKPSALSGDKYKSPSFNSLPPRPASTPASHQAGTYASHQAGTYASHQAGTYASHQAGTPASHSAGAASGLSARADSATSCAISDADLEVLKRVPAQALADELVRRSARH